MINEYLDSDGYDYENDPEYIVAEEENSDNGAGDRKDVQLQANFDPKSRPKKEEKENAKI